MVLDITAKEMPEEILELAKFRFWDKKLLLDDPEAFQEKTGGILTQPIIELEPGLYMGLRFDAQDAYKNLFDNLTSEPAV